MQSARAIRLTAAVVLTLTFGQLGFNCAFEKAEAAPNAAIFSDTPWYDNNGNYINAHGLGIIKVGSTYYLVGERRHNTVDWSGLGDIKSFFDGMSMYSSTDLQNWTYLGIACAPQSGTTITNQDIVERPKILFNAATNTYIMYMLPVGTYELKVRVTGAKDYYSSNYYAVIDRVTVTN